MVHCLAQYHEVDQALYCHVLQMWYNAVRMHNNYYAIANLTIGLKGLINSLHFMCLQPKWCTFNLVIFMWFAKRSNLSHHQI